MPEPHEFPDFEMYLRAVGDQLKASMPEGVGFALFMFGFNEDQRLSYISNANREDMRTMVHEWLARTPESKS